MVIAEKHINGITTNSPEYLFYGLHAAKELREDWHNIVADIPAKGKGGCAK